jgi:hypothetical protein
VKGLDVAVFSSDAAAAAEEGRSLLPIHPLTAEEDPKQQISHIL